MEARMDVKGIGNFLRRLRQHRALSIKQAAEGAGISATFLWQIEKGDRSPSADTLKKLARIYKVTTEELLEAAGYLREPGDDEKIEKAFQFVRLDPQFQFGTRVRGDLDIETKKFILELYEQAMGRKLI
jgi:transcriptional regulator with XRE-family HTH domain